MTNRRTFIKNSSLVIAGVAVASTMPMAACKGANEKLVCGLIGANGMGWADLNAFLKQPNTECAAICDVDENVMNRRFADAEKMQGKKPVGFKDYRKLLEMPGIDVIIIGTPDHWHCLPMVEACQAGKDVYCEKPLGNSIEEINIMESAANKYNTVVQVGMWQRSDPHWRDAVDFVKSGKLGKPSHFDLKYYHGYYLQTAYREKLVTRLTPAPDGGAMAELGSPGISLLMAFIREELEITGALQGGNFPDVPAGSDLFSSISLVDKRTGAVGNMSASRISSGTGDLVYLEIYAEKGAIRYSSQNSEYFEYYLEGSNQWIKQMVGSNYKPITSFPSGHVPPGWLRSMVHAHYRFFTGDDATSFNTDLNHGLAVQRIVRKTADHLSVFRKNYRNDE